MYSRLEFGSCYVYSKRGQSVAAVKSRGVRDRVKRADPEWLPKYAQRVREYVDAGVIEEFSFLGPC